SSPSSWRSAASASSPCSGSSTRSKRKAQEPPTRAPDATARPGAPPGTRHRLTGGGPRRFEIDLLGAPSREQVPGIPPAGLQGSAAAAGRAGRPRLRGGGGGGGAPPVRLPGRSAGG